MNIVFFRGRFAVRVITAISFVIALLMIGLDSAAFAQQASSQQQINLLGLSVQGNETASADIIRANSGLRVDQSLTMEDIQKSFDRLWELQLFSDIKFLIDRETPNGVYLIIQVKEHPRLNRVRFRGNDKIKDKKFEEELNLLPGQVLSPQQIFNTAKKMKELYKEENYLLAEVDWDTTFTEDRQNYVNLTYTIDEGKKVKIQDITFHGNDHIAERKLRGQMEKVKEQRWWKFFQDVEYTRENYLTGQTNVINYYKTQGYRDAEIVRDSVYYNDEKTRMFIDMWIDEGDIYTYGDFSWTGNSLYNSKELNRALGVEPGEQYDLEAFQAGIENVRSLYMDRGYLYFQVNPQEVPVGDNTVDITFQVQENYQVSVRMIDITGNTKTKEDVIRRELMIFPGDIFSRERLLRSQREIFILNYFSNVVPDVVPVDDKHVDLSVEVEEKQTDRANASVGYSERDGLLGSVGVEFNNLMGNGQQLVFNYQRGQYYKSFQFQFNEPWPFNRPNPVGFSVFSTNRGRFGSGASSYYLPFNISRRGGSVSIGHRFRWPDSYFRGNWSLYIDSKEYTNIQDSTTFQRIVRSGEKSTRGVRLTQTIRRDSRDRPEFPTEGSRVTFRSAISGGPLGGNEEYHKHELKLEWFTPMVWDLVLYTDIEAGAMKGLYRNAVIPYDEHFFMGGSGMIYGTALRGYSDRAVGPTSIDGYPLGGRAMLKYSLELRVPISDNPTLYGLGFFESGNTYLDVEHINPYALKRSAGVGFRLFMPMLGLLGFDFGYGFDSLEPGSTQPNGWQTHFIFGQPF
ncbi:MAG: outer membrane protein assembly factor BamA [Candidatus Marinimicrobia bacterium]|nr:outer membrane protein assembly factor BamA [Candidatus Neomarinimicrobiota bacterium]MCF7829226.1 outer membrane protein assembly factor BamA [Candidatus Neomarinimicrobiota bacterium]MCF7881121.1 outer membrane protein assembly factor BamA [Candidatus Neomarinimicrobiota bacterium]